MTLFDTPAANLARDSDPQTSKDALPINTGSHKYALLRAYYGRPLGLTDDEAAEVAMLTRTGYWKRCSDLRREGYIRATDETRVGRSGKAQRVCVCTVRGMDACR